MSDKSKIEWTDATWNPIRGCSRVSEGCRNCYAEKIAARFSGPGQPFQYVATPFSRPHPIEKPLLKDGRWTGDVRFIPELLDQPLHWRRPRRVFVNSMSDLFHEKVERVWIDKIFAAMLVCPQHTFQILTKRPERMRAYLSVVAATHIEIHMRQLRAGYGRLDWPWRNIWLGVSVEDQKTADERIPLLLQTAAAVRWVSYEPALGPVDFTNIDHQDYLKRGIGLMKEPHGLDWIVAGGESGPGARPAHPDWFRSVRDQCQSAGVPFFFKQWGEHVESSEEMRRFSRAGALVDRTDKCGYYCNETHGHVDHGAAVVMRVGKKSAGRLLDGREWNEFPVVRE